MQGLIILWKTSILTQRSQSMQNRSDLANLLLSQNLTLWSERITTLSKQNWSNQALDQIPVLPYKTSSRSPQITDSTQAFGLLPPWNAQSFLLIKSLTKVWRQKLIPMAVHRETNWLLPQGKIWSKLVGRICLICSSKAMASYSFLRRNSHRSTSGYLEVRDLYKTSTPLLQPTLTTKVPNLPMGLFLVLLSTKGLRLSKYPWTNLAPNSTHHRARTGFNPRISHLHLSFQGVLTPILSTD